MNIFLPVAFFLYIKVWFIFLDIFFLYLFILQNIPHLYSIVSKTTILCMKSIYIFILTLSKSIVSSFTYSHTLYITESIWLFFLHAKLITWYLLNKHHYRTRLRTFLSPPVFPAAESRFCYDEKYSQTLIRRQDVMRLCAASVV